MPRTKVTHVYTIQQVSSSSTILVVEDDQDAPDPIEYLRGKSTASYYINITFSVKFSVSRYSGKFKHCNKERLGYHY